MAPVHVDDGAGLAMSEAEGPFPGSRPLTADDIALGEMLHAILNPESPPGPPYVHMLTSDLVTWSRCRCPWWHHLPFVGRFVHAELP